MTPDIVFTGLGGVIGALSAIIVALLRRNGNGKPVAGGANGEHTALLLSLQRIEDTLKELLRRKY